MAIYWRLVNNSPSNVLQRLVYLCHSHLETAVFCTHLRVHSEQHTGGLYVHPTGQREIIITKGRSLLPKGDHYYQRESEQRGRGRGRYSGTHESEGPDWTQGGGREGDKWYRVIREPELICFGIFKGDKQAERCEGDVAPTRIFRGGKLGTGEREECGLAIQQLNRV